MLFTTRIETTHRQFESVVEKRHQLRETSSLYSTVSSQRQWACWESLRKQDKSLVYDNRDKKLSLSNLFSRDFSKYQCENESTMKCENLLNMILLVQMVLNSLVTYTTSRATLQNLCKMFSSSNYTSQYINKKKESERILSKLGLRFEIEITQDNVICISSISWRFCQPK